MSVRLIQGKARITSGVNHGQLQAGSLFLFLVWIAFLCGVLVIPTGARGQTDTVACLCDEAEPIHLPPGMMARVVIHPEAVVDGPDILLSDVACIAGDPETVRKLSELSIGAAPLIGTAREFHVATLNLRMRQGGVNDRFVQIVAPDTFLVRRDASVISGRELEERVRAAIASTLPEGAQLSLVFQPVADLAVPSGEVEVRISRMPQRLAGPISIGVDVYSQGKVWKSLTLRAEAGLVQLAWVATQLILKGEPLGPHNTELRHVEMNGTLQPADLGGDRPLRTNRIVQPDSVIEARFVETIPDASSGQSVWVTLKAPGMQLQARGTLLDDAMVGETVNVRNIDSGRMFSGRLVSSERVVVEVQ